MVLEGTLSGLEIVHPCDEELIFMRPRLSLEHLCDEIRLRVMFLNPDVISARFTLPLQEALVLEQATALRQLLVLLALEHAICVRIIVVTLQNGRKTPAMHRRVLLTAEAGGVQITGVNGAF